MKAVVIRKFGGPEVLEWTDFSDPVPLEDEVIVQVEATALNHLDIWIREGIPAYKTPLPHILGCDVAGMIIQLGSNVSSLKIGTRVIVSPGMSCFQCCACLSDQDNLCDSYRILGAGVHGGYAQFVKARARDVLPIPDHLDNETAAAFPLTFLTAWNMLVRRCEIKSGMKVLIHAAGSGVGSAAIQIAKYFGSFVMATVGSDEKADKARNLGADEVIIHTREDFSKKVRKITEGRGADIVFDHTGHENWEKNILTLTKGGQLVTCGATSGFDVKLDLRYVFSRELTILGAMMGRRHDLETILGLVSGGKLKPVIDSRFPLQEARLAQEKLLSRQAFGKILLKP